MKKIWLYIQSELLIILTIAILLIFGVLCWRVWEPMKDFGLNFFTEILGVIVTVFVIDRLIQNREERKNLPLKLAAYEDVRLYTTRYVDFWVQAYRGSVPDKDPETLKDFFSPNGMPKLFQFLYLESKPNVAPPRKWWDWIVETGAEFKRSGDKILERHSNNLDPLVYGYIHHLTESMFNGMLTLIPRLRQVDIEYKIPRIPVLGSYIGEPDSEDYTAILGLIDWCEKSYSKLSKYEPSIKRVFMYAPLENKKMPPKYMIPNDILERERKVVLDFYTKNK